MHARVSLSLVCAGRFLPRSTAPSTAPGCLRPPLRSSSARQASTAPGCSSAPSAQRRRRYCCAFVLRELFSRVLMAASVRVCSTWKLRWLASRRRSVCAWSSPTWPESSCAGARCVSSLFLFFVLLLPRRRPLLVFCSRCTQDVSDRAAGAEFGYTLEEVEAFQAVLTKRCVCVCARARVRVRVRARGCVSRLRDCFRAVMRTPRLRLAPARRPTRACTRRWWGWA